MIDKELEETYSESIDRQQAVKSRTADNFTAALAATGAVAGGITGLPFGPAGIAVGTVAGNFLGQAGGNTLSKLVEDFAKRKLSPLQNKRRKELIDYAVEATAENERLGREPRRDDYFDELPDGSSKAAIVAETAVFRIIDEPNYKKRAFLANIPIEMMYRSDVSADFGVRLCLLADRLTYRQYIIISMIGLGKRFPAGRHVTMGITAEMTAEEAALTKEIIELQEDFYSSKSLVTDYEHPLELTVMGRLAFELMKLGKIPLKDQQKIELELDKYNKCNESH